MILLNVGLKSGSKSIRTDEIIKGWVFRPSPLHKQINNNVPLERSSYLDKETDQKLPFSRSIKTKQ